MKEIILIGGRFHRKKLTIEDNQSYIRLPLVREPIPFDFNKHDVDHNYEEYGSIASIYGIDQLVPENVFLLKSLEPVIFIRNLLLDYCR